MRSLFQFLPALLATFLLCPILGHGQAGDLVPKPGSVFKDCATCPEMVVVPAGIYIMGLGAKRHRDGPPHRVNILSSFAAGRYEITFREWLTCVADGGCKHRPHDHNWGKKKRPVINVTLQQVHNYIKWLNRKTGLRYRLPSEAEWEYLHRGGTTTTFWWGNNISTNMANCRNCKSRECCSAKDHSCCSHGPQPVGSFPPNPFGLFDTAGNVFEWTEDCWNPDHNGAPMNGEVRTTGNCKSRVIRGGSFYYFARVARSFYRAKNPSNVKSYWLGFRVVRNLK